jgi:amidase
MISTLSINELSVSDIQSGYTTNQYTAKSLIQCSLDRIEKYDRTYNAFICLNPDAIHDAKLIDKRRMDGEQLGPLAGVTIIIKESINIAAPLYCWLGSLEQARDSA